MSGELGSFLSSRHKLVCVRDFCGGKAEGESGVLASDIARELESLERAICEFDSF